MGRGGVDERGELGGGVEGVYMGGCLGGCLVRVYMFGSQR